MSGSGSEFGVKQLFEDLETQKQKEKELKKQKRLKDTGLALAAVGLSLLGGLCGGVIFFAVRYFTSVFSVLFFLLNGMGAAAFYYEFMKPENKRKIHILFVAIGDLLSVFITLAAVFTLIPEYAEDRIKNGYSIWNALPNYLFGGMINNQIWIMGIILSAIGLLLGWLICRGIGRSKSRGK